MSTNEKPDMLIEDFWLSFKISMKNFYKNHKYSRPIDDWSEQLNIYQKQENYEAIENHIRNYMSLYAIDLMKGCSSYYIRILITNIKRWNLLSDKFSFKESESEYHNIIFMLIDIYKSLLNADEVILKKLFSEVELFLIYRNLDGLVRFSVDNNKPSILEKLSKYYDYSKINKIINRIYTQELKNINDKVSYKKIIMKIKNIY